MKTSMMTDVDSLHTDIECLYRAILSDPSDNTIRLVYADALEERGKPGDSERAEFIRIQCYDENKPRQLELLKSPHPTLKYKAPPIVSFVPNWKVWARVNINGKYNTHPRPYLIKDTTTVGVWDTVGIPQEEPSKWIFNRGFISQIVCDWDHWLKQGDNLVANEPITQVTLRSPPVTERVDDESNKCVLIWLQERSKSTLDMPFARAYSRIDILKEWDTIQHLLRLNWPTVTEWIRGW